MPQVDFTSFKASGARFLGLEAAERATKPGEVSRNIKSSLAILNQTKSFFKRSRKRVFEGISPEKLNGDKNSNSEEVRVTRIVTWFLLHV